MSRHEFRSLTLIYILLLALPLVSLFSHISKETTIFGRYSEAFFVLILSYGAFLCLLLPVVVLGWRAGQSAADKTTAILQWIGQRRLILVLLLIFPPATSLIVLERLEVYAPARSFVFQFAILFINLLNSFTLLVYPREKHKRVEAASLFIISIISVGLSLGFMEMLLRRFPTMIPASAQRRLADGGIFLRQDLIFDKPARFGYRFRPQLDEWREYRSSDGDLYHRLEGSIKPLTPDEDARMFTLHFVTDHNGFPNPNPIRDRYDIVVTGDSFGVPGPVEFTWPAILERNTGLAVLNLSIPGFGPGQEVESVKAFGLEKNPAWVIVGYFGGNDLFDVERYETIRISGLSWDEYVQKDGGVYRSSVALQSLRYGLPELLLGIWNNFPVRVRSSEALNGETEYRWPISIKVGSREVRMAFLPEYVSVLTASADDIGPSRNSELVFSALSNLLTHTRANGSRLLIVYIPSKPQVYLPLIQDKQIWQQALGGLPSVSLGPNRYLEFSYAAPATSAAVVEHMDDQRDVVAEFAGQEGIDFLDLTPEFRAKVMEGSDLYLMADTHLNQTGQDFMAQLVANYILTP